METNSNLPPYPTGILPWTEEEKKELLVEGDTQLQICSKLYQLWILWATYRNDKDVIDIINQNSDPDSDLRKMQNTYIQLFDVFGKILGKSNLTQELTFLKSTTNTHAAKPVGETGPWFY